jgi:hypothetical protein
MLGKSMTVAFLLLGLAAARATASTHLVRPDGLGEFPDIDSAIVNSMSGDTILLADGSFVGIHNRNLDFGGRQLVIRSVSGDPNLCVIDCDRDGRAFHFWMGETGACAIEGITMTHGWGNERGGAILCENGSNPTIRNCRFTDNTVQYCGVCGGAIAVINSSIRVFDSAFVNNQVYTSASGGAILCEHNSDIDFERCIFQGNRAVEGGAIEVCYDSHVKVDNCTIALNEASMGAGICCWGGSGVDVWGCTFAGNIGDDATSICVPDGTGYGPCPINIQNTIFSGGTSRPIFCGSTSAFTVLCTDSFGNAGGNWSSCTTMQVGIHGNIARDPLFCQDGYELRADSPCASGNNPACGQIGAWGVGCYGPMDVDTGHDRAAGSLAFSASGPNPFHDATHIAFVVPQRMDSSPIRLSIHDAAGRLIRSFIVEGPGEHTVLWDGRNEAGDRVAAGVYFYRLRGGGASAQMRAVMLP